MELMDTIFFRTYNKRISSFNHIDIKMYERCIDEIVVMNDEKVIARVPNSKMANRLISLIWEELKQKNRFIDINELLLKV